MNSVAISFENHYFPNYSNWEINRSHSTHHYQRHREPFELSSFSCSMCQQQFQSEKILNRHIRSRKHLKRLGEISDNLFNKQNQSWEPLPNKVIEAIIDDLKFDNKDEFFDGIQLLENDNLNISALSHTAPDADLSQHSNNFDNQMKRKKSITAHRIPPIYPCAMCFQSLDSQEDFDRHMRSTHIYFSIGATETNHLN